MVQRKDHEDCGGEGQKRHHAEIDRSDAERGGLERADGNPLAVGRKTFLKRVLNHDGQPERHQKGRQDVVAERTVQSQFLEPPAQQEHGRHGDKRREKRIQPDHSDQHENQIAAHHDQIAVGEVHQPHDAEHEAQPGCEQRVKPAEQHTLHNGVDPDHAAAPK